MNAAGDLPDPPPDGGLVERAKAGDQEAWGALYDWLHRPLLGYLRARGCSDPENALGEVFLRLARSLGGFTGGPEGLRAYAFTVAQNYLRDQVRAGKVRPDVIFLTPEVLAAHGGKEAPSVEEEALGSLSLSSLERALGDLTPEQRHVLYLRVIGDQSIAQVAQALGKSRGAVKQLHFRAMERLRARLAGGHSLGRGEA